MQERNESQQSVISQEKEPAKKLKFAKNNGFQAELRRRVDELFQSSDLRERDCPQMYIKTIVLFLEYTLD
jgi:linoleoyl-CoA desaturase